MTGAQAMTTARLTEEILIAASNAGHRLFRNNSGRFQDARGKWVTFGVGPKGGGGSDLIGWTKEGLFASIEIKVGKDRPTETQLMWIRWVNTGGGRAGVARSVSEALSILDGTTSK